MLAQGWPVLSILFVMSIASITVIAERLSAIRRARSDSKAFVDKVIRIVQGDGSRGAIEFCRKSDKPVAAICLEVLMQSGKRAARERAVQHALQKQVRKLEAMVPVLGTIASTAPFVGLLGTVAGIIKAFASIAANTGGGPEVVAAGIGEALITTACGLVVAIPALIGYNYCVYQIEVLFGDIELSVYDLLEVLCGSEDQSE
jgi:biopolymer transport protein ExbB/TolQ